MKRKEHSLVLSGSRYKITCHLHSSFVMVPAAVLGIE